MKKTTVALLATILVAAPLTAGVVFEVETTDHSAYPPRTEDSTMAAEGKNIKMEVLPGESGGAKEEAIYRGDRRQMIVVDEEEQSYVVIDKKTMAQLAGQVGGAMAQMQEALKGVPPDKRAAIEEMMKRQMSKQGTPAKRPATELKATGESATKSGYPCRKFEFYRDGRKLRELWVTDWSNIEGGEEVVDAFEDMSDFFREMADAAPKTGHGAGWGGDSVYERVREIGGFPVVTREFDEGGKLEEESTLRSTRRRTIGPKEFEPPAGYKRRTMLGGR